MIAPKLSMAMERRTDLTAFFALHASGGTSIRRISTIQRTSESGMAGLKSVHFGARCHLRHSAKYMPNEFLSVCKDAGGQIPTELVLAVMFRRDVLICVNLPASFLLVPPFPLRPRSLASKCWLTLYTGCLMIAAILIADAVCGYSRFISPPQLSILPRYLA